MVGHALACAYGRRGASWCSRGACLCRHEGERAAGILGWAPPDKVLAGILDDKCVYRDHYMKARAIALQLEAFGPSGTRPPVLTAETQRYFMNDEYVRRGSAALDSVLMDQIAMASLEIDPDRLTLARLDDLVGNAMCRDTIDVDAASDGQVSALLATRGRYVALVRGTAYVSLINREEAEHALLRQMVQPRTATE